MTNVSNVGELSNFRLRQGCVRVFNTKVRDSSHLLCHISKSDVRSTRSTTISLLNELNGFIDIKGNHQSPGSFSRDPAQRSVVLSRTVRAEPPPSSDCLSALTGNCQCPQPFCPREVIVCFRIQASRNKARSAKYLGYHSV